MTEFRPKLWTALGVAVAAGAIGLTACTGERETDTTDSAGAPAAPGATAGEGEGGEAGEAGAADAYAGVPAESRTALRLAHLEGFYRVALQAEPAEGSDSAAALAGQGLLEVYNPARATFESAGVNEAVLRRAAETGQRGHLTAAVRELETARRRAGGDSAAVVRGLTSIAAGLYRHVVVDGLVDPIEYQHSLGAALAAQAVAADASALAGQKADLDRLVALWPGPTAPEDAADAPAYAAVQAQASRIELAL